MRAEIVPVFLLAAHNDYSLGLYHNVKKRFLRFYSGHVFTFLSFFYFPNVFYFLKTLAKFRAASRLTRSTFKITATKETYEIQWVNK